MVQILLLILIILACASIIFLVIIQNSKGGGLASNMRAAALATQLMGPRRDSDFVEKATWWMISILVLITFVANFTMSSTSSTSGKGSSLMLEEALKAQAPNMAPTSVPQVPQGAPAGQGQAPAGQGAAPADAQTAPAEAQPAPADAPKQNEGGN